MKVSVEEINGRKCTVIRKPFCAVRVRGQLGMGVPVLAESGSVTVAQEIICRTHNGIYFRSTRVVDGTERQYTRGAEEFKCTLTILPALPRHPKPEDAPLLYRYMAEGLYPCQTHGNHTVGVCRNASQTCDDGKFKPSHCIDVDGYRVDVAIEDNE